MFKVGDKVEIIANTFEYNSKETEDMFDQYIGDTGEIIDIDHEYEPSLPFLIRHSDGNEWTWGYDDIALIKSRGFEPISTFENITIPQRKTKFSAGYDISVIKGAAIEPFETVKFDTGLKAYMLPDEFLGIHIRSSVGIKKGLILSNSTSIIDSDYYNNPDNEGHIIIALTNTGEFPQEVKDGECVAQGIFYKYLTVDNDCPGGKRIGGIGSTGE